MSYSFKTWVVFLAMGPCTFIVACDRKNHGFEATVSCVQPQQVSADFQDAIEAAPTVMGSKQILIKMSDLNRDFEQFRAEVIQEYSLLQLDVKVSQVSQDTVTVEFPEDTAFSSVIDRYIFESKIHHIEPDLPAFTAIRPFPATNQFSGSSLTRLGTQNFQSLSTSAEAGKEIIVAVIDTGVDYTHKDLAPYMWKNAKEIPNNQKDDDGNSFVDDIYGWDFANDDNDPMADDSSSYHGTHVAGIIQQVILLAEQGINIKIMAVKFLGSAGSGRTSDAIKSIDYAIKNGALVLNNSWGGTTFSSLLEESIERARAANALFVAAAGNGDSNGVGINIDNTHFYPAGYSHNNIISVAAANSVAELTAWSNYGPTRVEIAAPGDRILSTRNGDSYATLSGTSMAAPYIAGVAAMILSYRPDLGPLDAIQIISQSSTFIPSLEGKLVTNAIVNWNQALKLAETFKAPPSKKFIPSDKISLCIATF